jgi:hypothetical protein
VLTSLLLVVAVGKAHSCIVAAIAVVVAGTAAVGVGAADPRVGYTPYDTLEKYH